MGDDEELARIRDRMKEEILERARGDGPGGPDVSTGPTGPGSSSPAEPVPVTDGDLDAFVQRHEAAVVDVWAEWCGPCRRLEPVVEELAGELAGRVAFGKLDADDNPRTTQRFGVQAIPTLLLFRGGELVDRIVGAPPKATLEQRALQLAG